MQRHGSSIVRVGKNFCGSFLFDDDRICSVSGQHASILRQFRDTETGPLSISPLRLDPRGTAVRRSRLPLVVRFGRTTIGLTMLTPISMSEISSERNPCQMSLRSTNRLFLTPLVVLNDLLSRSNTWVSPRTKDTLEQTTRSFRREVLGIEMPRC